MISLIVNPTAGGGRCSRALPAVLDALRSHGLAVDLQETTSIAHAHSLGAAAAQRGAVAAAFGGDGLVAAVADALHDTDGVLAVIPGGRGNDFARSLGLPLDPVTACKTIASGRIAKVDLGAVGSKTFLSIATCGFDSDANRIANSTRLKLGSLVYAYGGLRALASWSPLDFSLQLDGSPLEFTGYTVAVANTQRYGGGMRLAPHARLDDGLFDVVMIGELSKLAFSAHLPRVFRGTHVRRDYVRVERAAEVQISASRPTLMYADGDPLVDLPATLRVLPRALQVMIPR